MSYTRLNLEKGNIFEASHLAHLEDGIANASNNTVIPSYWQEHLDSKIAEINSLNESVGGQADTFIFWADPHFPNNSNHSIALIKHLIENTSINKVFIGGDIIEGNQGNAIDMALLRSIKKELKDVKIFPVRGNHDAHTSDILDNQWWDVFQRDLVNYCEISDKMYYYHDNSVQKIRYIFADSVWGYGKYASNSYLISDEQLDWIKEKILELDSDWTVLIVKHHLWDFNKLGTLNAEGTRIKNAIDDIYYDADCVIAGVLAGHAHYDHLVTTDQGYILATTIGDNNQVSGWKNGTIKEQAFDVVSLNPYTGTFKTIRIGDRGPNREFNYSLINEIIAVEGVSLSAETLTLGEGKTKTLTATLTPTYVSNKNVSWSITNGSEYVSINPNGLECIVTTNAVGNAVITVTTEDGSHTAYCSISVIESTDVDITDQFNFTEGGMISANDGKYSTYSGWIANENFVDISAYSAIEIKMSKTSSTGTGTGLAFYDADKNYISGIPHTDGVATYGVMIKNIDIPANAVYVRTTYWSTSNSSYNTEFGDFYCKGVI